MVRPPGLSGAAPPTPWSAPKAPSASPWSGGARRGEMLTRDYFRVEDEAGLRFWLVSRRTLRPRDRAGRRQGRSAALVHARIVRMTDPCLCGDRRHHQFLVSARRLASAGICASGRRIRPACHRDRRPQYAGRRGAGLRRTEKSGTDVQAETADRIASRLHRRHAGHPGLSARPRRLWPALPSAEQGQTRRGQRRVPSAHRGLEGIQRRAAAGADAAVPVQGRCADADAGDDARHARGWRVARRQSVSSRRRQAPSCQITAHRHDRRRAVARHQRRAVPRLRAPGAAGCRHLRPREDDH